MSHVSLVKVFVIVAIGIGLSAGIASYICEPATEDFASWPAIAVRAYENEEHY